MTRKPERTCVACREVGDKAALVRLARGSAGEIVVDALGKLPGRGAWLHPSFGCIEVAVRKGVLANALRTSISSDELGRLRNTMSQGAL